MGACRLFPQIPTLLQTKKCNFPHPFSDQTSKTHTRFQTWAVGRNYVIITYTIERKQKKFFKFISNSHIFLVLSYSFEMETINFSYIPVVPSKIIPNSRLKWAKCRPVFRSKRRKNPTRWGGTYLFGLYKGVPPPGIEQIHVALIAFVYLEYKQNSFSKSNQSCR